MKPSFTPCFFSKRVLVLRAQVLHRLEVDLVERGEQRLRLLRFEQALRDARAQPRHRHALFAARPAAPAAAGAAGACGRGGRLVATGRLAAGLSRYSTTSPFVMRPSRPDAGIFAGSSCFSSTMRRTEGASLSFVRRGRGRGQSAFAAAACRRRGRRGLRRRCRRRGGAFFEHREHLPARHATCRRRSAAPSARRSPARALRARPCRSRGRRDSRRAPRSARPACARSTSVASATDSGSCGTLISMVMSFLPYRAVAAVVERSAWSRAPRLPCWSR